MEEVTFGKKQIVHFAGGNSGMTGTLNKALDAGYINNDTDVYINVGGLLIEAAAIQICKHGNENILVIGPATHTILTNLPFKE